jgi:hypothetical protein
MEKEKPGIKFSEVMKGGFSLDETDPVEGKKRGEAEETILALHAAISINDLDRFITDPNHSGSITGHIGFAPLGEELPAKGGKFNLFSPADDPGLKLMVYEMAFEAGGQDYYLEGWKEVKDGPGLDLWKDTTTLFAKLHKGADKTGPVAGAGVLRLGVPDLIKMISTMRATQAGSAAEQARAVSKFGRFFLGELWSSYGAS